MFLNFIFIPIPYVHFHPSSSFPSLMFISIPHLHSHPLCSFSYLIFIPIPYVHFHPSSSFPSHSYLHLDLNHEIKIFVQDYPSVNQIFKRLEASGIQPIFAVPKSTVQVKNTYQVTLLLLAFKIIRRNKRKNECLISSCKSETALSWFTKTFNQLVGQNIILKKLTETSTKCEFSAIVLHLKIHLFCYQWSITIDSEQLSQSEGRICGNPLVRLYSYTYYLLL